MDLDLSGAIGIVSADKINDGVWIHLERPQEDGSTAPWYHSAGPDYPVRARVRSYRCAAIRKAEKAQQRLAVVAMNKAKKNDKEAAYAENASLPDDKRFALTLVQLENIGAKPGVQEVSEDQAVGIFNNDELQWLVEQVRAAAFDDAKYLNAQELKKAQDEKEAAEEKAQDPPKPARSDD